MPDTSKAPFPYVSCRHHLWLVEQRDRAGNPSRGAQGDATIRAATMTSCPLDAIGGGPTGISLSYEEIGEVLGIHHTRVRQLEEQALAKLAAHGIVLRPRST